MSSIAAILTTMQNPISSLSYIDNATNTATSSTATVTIPSTAKHGDLVIIYLNVDTNPWTITVPTGWTKIGTTYASGGTNMGIPIAKVITHSEVNTTVSITHSAGNTIYRCSAMVFRPVGRIYSFTASGYLSVSTSAAITTQTLGSSAASATKFPVLTLAQVCGRPDTQAPVLTTTSNDGVINPGGSTNMTIGYKFFAKGSTTADVTASCTDGGQQYLDMFYITF